MDDYNTEVTVCFTENASFPDTTTQTEAAAERRAANAVTETLKTDHSALDAVSTTPLSATRTDGAWTVVVEVCATVTMQIEAQSRADAVAKVEPYVAETIAADDNTPALDDVTIDVVVLDTTPKL